MLPALNWHPIRRACFLPKSATLLALQKKQVISMASNCKEANQQHSGSLQIYPSTDGISSFWKEKYERDARKYWDVFYKRHQDKFFKDRHYLDKEWGPYFSGGKRVVLEVGCGAGNTIYPLLTCFPDIFVHACDFSSRAINLVKTHKDYDESLVNAFVCDLVVDDLIDEIPPSSVDVVTMMFVLSAVSPEKMSLVLQNLKRVLKPNGYILLRDYAAGDLSQERFSVKDQKISENFYVRGDGTRAYYFSEEILGNLFKSNGFEIKQLGLCCKQVENRSRKLVMNRRWIQAVFQLPEKSNSSRRHLKVEALEHVSESKIFDGSEIDMSEGLAAEMFAMQLSKDKEVTEVTVGDWKLKVEVLSKEYQHTCKSTGMILWESARLMAVVLDCNPFIVSGKRVLELGCGCGGICSMVAASRSADLVIATDGDENALGLLATNISSNLRSPESDRLVVAKLEWGTREHIAEICKICPQGFDVIIGTDVTYSADAIGALFATARQLVSPSRIAKQEPSLILCQVLRRVDEASLQETAAASGFRLIDTWPSGDDVSATNIITSWLSPICTENYLPTTALCIMCFNLFY